ncbi:MAG: hypothetical protein ACXIVG_14915 [Pararhodobacter sp.]
MTQTSETIARAGIRRRLVVPGVVLALLAVTGVWAHLALAPLPQSVPLSNALPGAGDHAATAPLARFTLAPGVPPDAEGTLARLARLQHEERAPLPRRLAHATAPGAATPAPSAPPSQAPASAEARPIAEPASAPEPTAAQSHHDTSDHPGTAPPTAPDPAASAIAATLGPPPASPPTRPRSLPPSGTVGAALTSLHRSPQPPARSAVVARLASTQPTALARVRPETRPLAAIRSDAAAGNPCSDRTLVHIPRRPGDAAQGSTLAERLDALAGAARDRAIAREIMAGNLPEFLRQLVPVTLVGAAPGQAGGQTRITLCVMPDYLALGADGDFLRVPLGLPAASRIADAFGMILPTTAMVDAIHAQARIRLPPTPMSPGPQMASTAWFVRHNATLEGQRRAAGGQLGQLVSGHKKDVVLTNRLHSARGRVAIYGWHRASGQPIQPLSTVHGEYYADYSHGLRLISRHAYVNGRPADLRELLADPHHAAILSHEGPVGAAALLAARF